MRRLCAALIVCCASVRIARGLGCLANEASRIERAQHLQATPYERSAQRMDYANGYKPKTVLTRLGEVTFEVPQVGGRLLSQCPGAWQPLRASHEPGTRPDVGAGRLHPQSDHRIAKAGGPGDQHFLHANQSLHRAARHRVATLFPNPDSCLRWVSALLAEQDEEWVTAKIYLNMKP